MKRFALACFSMVALLSGCNDEKPEPNATYFINGEFAIFDGGPSGESLHIKVQDSTYKASRGSIAFDIIINNTGFTMQDAPDFHAVYKGRDCGDGVVTKKLNGIKEGESRKVTIIWNCGESVNLADIALTTKLGDTILTWVHS